MTDYDYRGIDQLINRRRIELASTTTPVHVGGAVQATSITGVGVTASAVTAVASATTQLWAKGRVAVDTIRALGNGTGWEFLYIDNNGATPKIECYIECTGVGGPYIISMKVVSNVFTLNSGNITQASLPANGQDVIWAIGYDNSNLHQRVWLFDSLGNVLGSGATNSNDGALSTGNGFIGVNSNSGNASARACIMDGVAIYVGAAPADGNSAWWSKPLASDSNIQYLNYMNDAQTGTTPAISVAAVGSVGLTWTAGQFNYTTDVTTGNWG